MLKLNQSHKIAISVASIFMVSLSIMMFLLSSGNQNLGHVQANVSHSGSAETSAEHSDTKSEDTYKSYFKDPYPAIFSVDSEGKFEYANDDFCKLIDQNCEKIMGTLFFEQIHSTDLADMASKHAKIVKDGKDLNGVGPFRLNRKGNGNATTLVIFDIHAILDDKKGVSEIVFSVKDITEKVNNMTDDNNADAGTDYSESEPTDSKDTIRPGDSRLMVDKISFNVHLLKDLF
jgi:PAS domain S-box-containing protein